MGGPQATDLQRDACIDTGADLVQFHENRVPGKQEGRTCLTAVASGGYAGLMETGSTWAGTGGI